MTPEETCKHIAELLNDLRRECFKAGMEEAAKICDYREDLQIKTCGDDRAIEARCCAEDIREAKDKL